MRAVLDTCVLYPTVMREVLLAVAAQGLFTPLWSPRILEEWARVAARQSAGAEVIVRGEIARLSRQWLDASVIGGAAVEHQFWLPDANDIHVLASAVAGGAAAIITMNLRDFPRRELAPCGVTAIHPDAFLRQLFDQNNELVVQAVSAVQAEAARVSGGPVDLRQLLKRAGLPRLAKAVGALDPLRDQC